MDLNSITLLAIKLLAVSILVMLNGFFVAAEFAVVKVRLTQLETLIAKGQNNARAARYILANLTAFLSAAQLGITLASLGLGWVGEPVFSALLAPVLSWLQVESAQWRHTISFIVGFSAITFLHIVAGEQAPKALAIQHPLATSLWIAHPLQWFYKVSYPFIWILNQTSLWLLRQVGITAVDESEPSHSEEEVRLILNATRPPTSKSHSGRDIVLNALDLRHRVVREVMRPRHEMVCLDTQASLPDCLNIAEKTRFSRFPLCADGDLDRTLGTVHIKDLYATRLKARSGADLTAAARKILYVPPTARLELLLRRLLDQKLHLAIVVDEYGGTVGMVTLENILEELVGQIQDEFDQEKPWIETLNESTWLMIGTAVPDEGISTTSGFVTRRLGGFPKVGDTVHLGSHRLSVEAMNGPRVGRLRLERVPAPASDAPENTD
jgi:CBS domain containing-hemolysin-like protein